MENQSKSQAVSPWIGPILLAGIATTLLTLFLVWVTQGSVNIMGWYANRIIPVGAIFVGLLAGSGYSIVIKQTGTRVGKSLIFIILGLQVIAYFLIVYLKYMSLKAMLSEDMILEGSKSLNFWSYFDASAQSLGFKPRYGDGEATPLGMWGYGIKFLEIVGFCAGTLIFPLVLKGAPHCEACQRYKKTRFIALIPAMAPDRKVNKKDSGDVAAYEKEMNEAMQKAVTVQQGLLAKFAQGEILSVMPTLQELRKTMGATANSYNRLRLDLIYCPSCSDSVIKSLQLVGQGNESKTTQLGELQPLASHHTKDLLDRLKASKI
jgi:hypothetical protein